MDNGNGETAPPEQPESSRGAGGKIRKHPNGKPRTTPYARPPLNQSHQTPLAVRGGGGWLSKLVDPACRLIGAGATRLLPSLFSRSPTIKSPASSSSDEDELQGEAEHEDEDGIDKGNSDLALTKVTQSANAESVEDGPRSGGLLDAKGEGKNIALPNTGGLSEIEQLIKGKMFSRAVFSLNYSDEVDRLLEILHSKTVDRRTDEGRDKQPATDIRGKVQGHATAPEFASGLKGEKQEAWNRVSGEILTPLSKANVRNEIGASPVDIARAYMGNRMSEIGSSAVATATGDDRALVDLDGHSSKPFIALPSHNSSIRWPGATVPDRYMTPQTQRSRYGLHDFRRTPYSRTVHSMSKSKPIHIGDDGSNSLETESPLLKQSQTALNRQARSRSNIVDVGYGSVGPIRRPRHKLTLGTPQKFVNLPPLASPSQREDSNSPLDPLPAYRKKMVYVGGSSSSAKPQWADDRPQSLEIGVPTVPRHSSQMARKILEHLDRNFPTPKEKSAELKLANSWKKTIFSDAILVGDAAISHEKVEKWAGADAAHLHESRGTSFKLPPERSTIRIADAVGRKTSVFDANLRSSSPANGANAESANEVSELAAPTAIESQLRDAVKQPPLSAAKAGLPAISIENPVRAAFSSGSSSGFEFPVSASPAQFPEPPTPSLTLPPRLTNSHPLQKEEESIPSYTFGSSNRSSPALVFSFPSTSSSSVPVDAADLKFSFGSGERRMSFASIARDGVCC
ncbi:nuclear pore complex protein NUP1 isoform X2 [Punica granatum]|uniref:Nuclear pore complex protein NUP1 isoform X2 n=1 Tax=Punica granatum TaxID=22663 RepID=A0A6P8CDC5_PUNGR|nr:nuclear pore complex protein NUP1 isoform X2 [Punica granatum]